MANGSRASKARVHKAGAKFTSLQKVSKVVRQALAGGATVEIDGLGSFRKNGDGYRFHASGLPRIFVAYVHEDGVAAGRIFDALLKAGFDPWMDVRKLLPGQNWPRAIRNAMETSDLMVCCFSRNSTHKRGGFQAEIRYAIEGAKRMPLDEVFLVPVRLDDCPMPVEVSRDSHYVNLFPDWNAGIERLVEAIRYQSRPRRAA
jgi:hypothetical protein